MKTTGRFWTRWAPLLVLTAILAGCGPAVTPTDAPAPAPAPTPAPAEPLATCGDSAIRLLGRGAGIHGAIVADTLHMGGVEAPVTCADPANLSLEAGLSMPDDWTAQVQQSQYYLIVINYPGGNRLYVISRRADGSTCIVDTNDRCIAQVTELPDDFDLQDLPEDVAPTIPAGRPAPELPAAPAAAGNPQPRDGATGVAVETLLLSWSAAAQADSYEVYWGATENLTADADLGTPIATTSTATTIRRPGATAAERRLALGTTYYWRVDTKNDQGTTTGSVWSFTTADQAAPPPPGGGGYTPPIVSPPPAEPPPAAPVAAGNPQPRHGATGVAVETLLLSWSAAARAASYDVYWGREEHLTADADLGTPIATTFTATTIRRPAPGTTYYWRVDAKNGRGTTTGNVWSFTTADRAAPPPVTPGGGYTPPVVSPPPAEPPPTEPPPAEPPPAEEPPPAGPPQPAVAPAWPGGAQHSFEFVVGKSSRFVVTPPTGTPTPVVTTSPGYLPRTSGWPNGIDFFLWDGNYIFRNLDYSALRRGSKGVITLTATNSAGTAKTTVSYTRDCYSSDAEIANWLKGTAWEPVNYNSYLGRYYLHSNSWYRRAVFNDTATALTVTTRYDFATDTRVAGTERLTGGIRLDSCNQIRGPDWAFVWAYHYADDEEVVEGKDVQCDSDGRGRVRGGFSLSRWDVPGSQGPRRSLSSVVHPDACRD